MIKFHYIAIDQNGDQKTGIIEAISEDAAKLKLNQNDLLATQIRIKPDSSSKVGNQSSFHTSTGNIRKVKSIGKKNEKLVIFTRQLATLSEAGLPLLRNLEIIVRQEKDLKFKQVVLDLAEDVKSGNNLSDGLTRYPKIFNQLFVSMIKAGEAGGEMAIMLDRLATFQEKSEKIKKRIKTAMVYPLFVTTISVLIVTLLIVFVVPRFQEIFDDLLRGAALPAMTQVVIDTSKVMEMHYKIIIPLLVGLFFLFKLFGRTNFGGRILDWIWLHLPKVRDLVKKVAISRFCRTLGTLLDGGVPILESLKITRNVVGNRYIMDALDTVHDRVRDGEDIAAPLERTKLFPEMVTSMIDVGEETGNVSNMLNRVADNYDEEIDNAINGITSVVEPVMIVILAVVVGFIVIALFMPIIEIIKNLSS